MRAAYESVNAVETKTKMKFLSGLMRHAKRRGREREQALSLYIAAVEQVRQHGTGGALPVCASDGNHGASAKNFSGQPCWARLVVEAGGHSGLNGWVAAR